MLVFPQFLPISSHLGTKLLVWDLIRRMGDDGMKLAPLYGDFLIQILQETDEKYQPNICVTTDGFECLNILYFPTKLILGTRRHIFSEYLFARVPY